MNTDSNKSTEALLLNAMEIESQVARLYQHVAQLFAHVPEVALFWEDLARDEEHHRSVIIQSIQQLSPQQLHAPADAELWDCAEQVLQLLDRRALQPIETLDDAYELAHSLEFSEIITTFEALASRFSTAELKEHSIRAQMAQHQNKIANFSQTFGDKAWREQIVAQES